MSGHEHGFACSFGSPTCPEFGTPPVEWERPGWRLGPHRFDWLRSLRCLIVGHRWDVNRRRTQRSCPRCWIVQDATTPLAEEAER
jgi:hypothetical protein